MVKKIIQGIALGVGGEWPATICGAQDRIDVTERIVEDVSVTIPCLRVPSFRAGHERVGCRKPTQGTPVVAFSKEIKSGFIISFFEGELLPHTITSAVTLRCRSSAGASKGFLTERQLEDAVTPHLTRA